MVRRRRWADVDRERIDYDTRRARELRARALAEHERAHDWYRRWDPVLNDFVMNHPTYATDGPITTESIRCWICGAVRSRTFNQQWRPIGGFRYWYPSPALRPPVDVIPGEPEAPSELPSLGSFSPSPPTVEGGPGDA